MKKFITITLSIVLVLGILIAVIPQTRLMATITFLNMITTTSFEVDDSNDNQLLMNGDINSKTFKQLKKIVKEHPQITTIVMLDVPGSLDDETNFKMCRWIRDKGFNTVLLKDSHVASGGTDFFLSGVSRTLSEGALVGVHSWRDSMDREAKDIPKDHPDHEMNRKYIEDMLGKDDFYWYTIYAASADDIYYMTLEEMKGYNMYTSLIE